MSKVKVWYFACEAPVPGNCTDPEPRYEVVFLKITEVASKSGGFSAEVIIEQINEYALQDEEKEALLVATVDCPVNWPEYHAWTRYIKR